MDEKSVLAVKILSGGPAAYSASPNKPIGDYPESAGQQTLLVSAVQARNNARVVLSGSIDLFTNEFFNAAVEDDTGTGNALFAAELSKWFVYRSLIFLFDSNYYLSKYCLGLLVSVECCDSPT